MSTTASRFSKGPWRRAVSAVAVLALAAMLPAVSPAQEDVAGLAAEVREHFRVLPLTDGVLLEPRDPATEVSVVEVREGNVAVDGAELTETQLLERLGEDAGTLVLRLGELGEDELAAILTPADAAPGEPATPLDAPDATPPTPAPAPTPTPAPASEPPEPPRSGQADDRVVMGGSVHIREGERAKDVVVFGGTLQMDGEAYGDVAVFGGAATVDGPVHGDVALIGGSLELGPRARIEGDLSVVGGGLKRHPDAVVEGEVAKNVPFSFDWNPFEGATVRHRVAEHMADEAEEISPFVRVVEKTFFKVSMLLLISLLALLVVLIARRPLERTAERIRREPAKSGLVGLAIEILILPVTVAVVILLAVSIIGIPLLLLVPFALIGAVLVAFFGYCAAVYRIGDWVRERFSWDLKSPYLILLLGMAVLGSLGIVGALLHFGWLSFFAALLIALGALAGYLAWTVGLGAAALEWLASRREPPAAATPAPPPAAPPAPEPAEGA